MPERKVAKNQQRYDVLESAYCSFTDDRERRRALISRDIRLVLMRALSISALCVASFYGKSHFPF
ncbi:hypothetical protein PPN31114_00206 [Pandoraea pneumonica]|uniref:Transposase n=1 Tax=Pandoraea pneumonica TaxID=2508299 RepID=A0A5E4RII9_9BURK|nr:hypothetical protein PPN31114_00206 [Pandoraea pneumonica]